MAIFANIMPRQNTVWRRHLLLGNEHTILVGESILKE
jgi:hypothetical protein